MLRGRPFGDLADEPFAAQAAAALAELDVAVAEERMAAELAAGRHADVLTDLERLTSAHPLRERLWELRILALYRTGRQAEALRVYQDLRAHLADEVGIEPTPALRSLEAAVLAQDPSLALPVASASPAAGGLPSGVVTFLLTDIADSTAQWDRHPSEMAEVVERHEELVGVVTAEHGGVLLKSKGEGDSTMTVFRRATDAARAATELHVVLAAEPWPAGITVGVRAALHTGEAHERCGDYFGPAVNLAARLRALAEPGQTVVSQATAEVIHHGLPDGTALRPLGPRALRGISRAEHIHVLVDSTSAPPPSVTDWALTARGSPAVQGMTAPDVRYATNAGISIAYQVFGEGPRDLIFVCGTMSHLELFWQDPRARAMLERLGRFARVLLFDKPGTGLSDPIPAAPTIDQRTADIVAVMDAAGSERAVVVGYSEGGLPAMMLAASHPPRVEALVLVETVVAMEWQPGMQVPPEDFDNMWGVIDAACDRWGEGVLMAALAPTWVEHPTLSQLLGPIERTCMSPGMARSVLQGYRGLDMRDAAAAIHVPTLVLQGHNRFVTHAMGRDLVRRIDGAWFVELEGTDHLVWIRNADQFPDSVEAFVTGRPPALSDDDRILTTVVFTEFVDSARRLAEVGETQWRVMLADHDHRMHELLDRFGGLAVKHTGDGRRVAHFPRPARAVRFAQAMCSAARGGGLEIRAGVHTGECELVGNDLFGFAVNVGARIAARAQPGEVLVSSTVREIVVGSGLAFSPRGEHELEGAPGTWALYHCDGDRPGPLVAAGYDTDVRHQ